MFFHNFKYILKTLLKNKPLIFWTFAFPLIMGTFFSMAFSGVEDKESFNPIDIAIINNEELKNNIELQKALDNVSDKESDFQIFNTKYVTLEEAERLLSEKEIVGYLYIKDGQQNIIVSSNSINSTIMKSVIDEINETITVTNDLYESELSNLENISIDYELLNQKISAIVSDSTPNINDTSSGNLSYITIEYYTLIAMTCLYGGTISMYAINITLANMSSKGKRISISPTSKTITILSSLFASFIVQLLGTFILLAFLYFAIKVDFGTSMSHCILLSVVGSLSGLSLGLCIGSVFKTNENGKIGIIIAISMACSFLSGMMGVLMKYYVDKYIPFLNKVNPANMITDAFYSLYYYNTLNRFYFNIISLLLFSGLLIIISCIVLRRQKYDSI